MSVTPEQITQLKGLLEKATPGPWSPRATGLDDGFVAVSVYEERGLRHTAYPASFGCGRQPNEINAQLVCETINALPSLLAAIPVAPTVRPLSEWHEDYGDVLWYRFPIDEPPYVGSPLDLGKTVEIEFRTDETAHIKRYHVGGWPGYHTHWTPITLPTAPTGEGE